MSGSNAFSSDMPGHEPPWGTYGPDSMGWDEDTADRILDGLSAEDAPPGSVGVARILAAASAPASRDELAGEAFAVTAFRLAALEFRPTRPARSRSAIARLATPKAAAIAIGLGVVVNGGLAAAGTHSLPGPAQWAASEILGIVGINVPDADTHVLRHHPARTDRHPATSNSTAPGSGGSGGTAAISSWLPGVLGADGRIGSSRVATGESNAFPSAHRVNQAGHASLGQTNPANPAGPPRASQANASSPVHPAGPPRASQANASSPVHPAGPPRASQANASSPVHPAGPPRASQTNASRASASSPAHPANPANPAGPPRASQANASSPVHPAGPPGVGQANASSSTNPANPAGPPGVRQANASSSTNPANSVSTARPPDRRQASAPNLANRARPLG
jgi:hypothetical protein